MAFDERAAVERFWEARRRGEHFPAEWRDRLSVEQAYRVQLGVVARRVAAGERQAGWKVGMTSEAIQRHFGFREPVFGCLMDEGVKRSGHVFDPGGLIRPNVEPEVCVRMAAPLSGAVDEAAARRAADLCYPALEVAEMRGDVAAQIALAIADNAAAKAVVLGEPVPLGDRRLAEVEARVEVNGAEVERARAEAVLGDPIRSVVWLAGKLAEFGLGLRAGDLIMTGSFTRLIPLGPGDRMRAEFSGLGVVETGIAAA
jgi:2-keto-4-pentenoate hydratase